MIAFEKPLYAKIYDYDAECVEPCGEDELGKYAIQEVATIYFPRIYQPQPYLELRSGIQSKTFKILEQENRK